MKIIRRSLPYDYGLDVVLVPVVGAKTVTGVFGVRAGSKYEDDHNHGIAHFLEHMAFKGTKKRPTSSDIAKEIESRGGDLNAFTGKEATNYFVKLPSKYMETVCDILSDMVINSRLEEEEIEKEKGTVIQEIRMGYDNPSRFVWNLWSRVLYGDQTAGRSGLGTEESIKAMTREHFCEFLNSLYISGNAVFCLAGKIGDPDKAFLMVHNFFKNIGGGLPKIKKISVIDSQEEPALLLEPRDIKQSCLVLGVRAYNLLHEKIPALEIMSNILGGTMFSRLWNEIREKRGLAYYINSFVDGQTDVGSFGIYSGIDKEKVFGAIKIILSEFRKLCEEKVSVEELKMAKNCLIGSNEMQLENSQFLAMKFARQIISENKITSLKEESQKIKKVTRSDIQEVAQEIFKDKGLNLAIIGPHKDMEEELKEVLKF